MSSWANTWFAGIDGVQHPGVTLNIDSRLTTRGTLRVKIKEAKDLTKGMTPPQYCTVRVGELEHKVDVIHGSGSEVRWNSDLDFVLEGGEEYFHVSLKNDERSGRSPILASCIIPLSELLAAIHPSLPPPPPPHDQSAFQEEEATKAKAETRKALIADCKHIMDAIGQTSTLSDHVKDSLKKILTAAQADPPRHGAWFTLYDEKLSACGLLSMQFNFFPDYYQLIPQKTARSKDNAIPIAPSTPTANKLKSVTTAASGMAGAVRAVAGTAAGAVLGMAKSVQGQQAQPTSVPEPAPEQPPGKFFGVPLSVAIEQSNAPIPLPVSTICEYLEKNSLNTEGLFRVGGNKMNVDSLIDAFKRGEKVVLGDTHDASATLKAYFRQMPEPLIPFSHYTGLVAIADGKTSQEEKKQLYKSMLSSLPEQNVVVLRYLLAFLSKVAENSSMNLMAADNLAIVFGPNLLRQEEEDVGTMLSDTGLVNQAISALISHATELLPPPKNAASAANNNKPPAGHKGPPPSRPPARANPSPNQSPTATATATATTATAAAARPPPSAAQALEYTQNKLLAGVVNQPTPAPPAGVNPKAPGRTVTAPRPVSNSGNAAAAAAAAAGGASANVKRCDLCNTPLKPMHRFCVECGKPCAEMKDFVAARPRSETMTPRIAAAAKAFEG